MFFMDYSLVKKRFRNFLNLREHAVHLTLLETHDFHELYYVCYEQVAWLVCWFSLYDVERDY